MSPENTDTSPDSGAAAEPAEQVDRVRPSSETSPENAPAIPLPLQHLRTVGGLVVPWITPRTPDDRIYFGSVDRRLVVNALQRRWCGVCGQPLTDRLVLMMRLSDLPRRCTIEPPLHPWCAAYSGTACPMLNGRMRRYRTSEPQYDTTVLSAPDAYARRGAPAEPWFAVWLSDYDLTTDHGNLAASFTTSQLLRIRPVIQLLPRGA